MSYLYSKLPETGVSPHIGTGGLGHEIQFTESEIMVAVLLKLKAQNIVALPVHDAVVIRASQAEQAQTVMGQIFRLSTTVALSVLCGLCGLRPDVRVARGTMR